MKSPRRQFICMLCLCILLASCCKSPEPQPQVSGLQVYVSPQGSDAAKGTREAPFASIQRARDEVRAVKESKGLPDGATVHLGKGCYFLEKSLCFKADDSGTEGAPIVYLSSPTEPAVLMGGIRIPTASLQPISDPVNKARILDPVAGEKIREVDLRALGVTGVGQLSRRGYHRANELQGPPPMEVFVDGVPLTLARWPNTGQTVRMGEILDPGPLDYDPQTLAQRTEVLPRKGNEVMAKQMEAAIGRERMDELMKSRNKNADESIPFPINLGAHSPELHKRGGAFHFDYDRPIRWADSQDIWITGIFGLSWEYSYNQVAAFDKTNRTVTLRYGEISGINKNWFADYHHYENVFEEIDLPGEYYIDRQAMKLFVYLPETFTEKSEIFLSALKQPVLLTTAACHLEFRNLHIAGGRNDGVVISQGRDVVLADSTIRSLAGNGAVIRESFQSGLRHCEIHHVGRKGVVLGGGDWAALRKGENFVEKCDIHDFAFRDKAYNPGVSFEQGSVGNRVTGSRIHNGPHGGILLAGNDHLIQGNNIYQLCEEFLDFGAIYAGTGTRPMDRGAQIIGNYIHDIRPDQNYGIEGIYLDVANWDVQLRQNIIANVGSGIMLKGQYLVAENNFFSNVRTACSCNMFDGLYWDDWKRVFAESPPEKMPHGKKYPELLHFWEDIAKYGKAGGPLNFFADNVIFDPKRILETPNGVSANPKDTPGIAPRLENNLVLKKDPGFVDWKSGDFRYTGNDPDLRSRLAFLDGLIDNKGRFFPAADAGVRR